jgi:imidazolonepropionase-like amidohydrolase
MSRLNFAGAARIAAALAVLPVLSGRAARAQEGPWVLTNARIETVTHGVIAHGTIVIRNGLIAAVGADVTAPPEARVLDLGGRTVSPGLIDLTSSLGLPTAPAAPAGPGGGGAPAAAAAAAGPGGPANSGLDPDRVVADEFRPGAADIKAARDAGVTAVLSAPSRGAFRGLSALVPTRDSAGSRDVLRSPVALHMGYQGIGGGFGGGFQRQYPGTLLGVIAYERQKFYDAQRQAMLLDRYRANPRGMQRPANDNALAALIPVVKGDLPVFFAANNENEIDRAINIAHEFNLKLTIVGASEGFRVTDALVRLRRPVVVSVDFPRPADVTGWAYRGAERLPANDSVMADSAAQRMIQGNAASLMRAGVRFALASGGTRGADFIANVKKAVAAGLPRDSALAAVTIRPAEIAGVAEQLGSIESGKVANLVVSDGDLLGDSGRVRMVFVDGTRYTVDAPAPAAGGGGPGGRGRGRFGGANAGGGGGAAETAQVAGTWDITVNAPQGSQQSVLTLTQAGSAFTGNQVSQMGTVEVAGGQVEGRHVSWTITISMNGQSLVVTFSADVDGNHMTGSASGDFGSAPFTGEKRP